MLDKFFSIFKWARKQLKRAENIGKYAKTAEVISNNLKNLDDDLSLIWDNKPKRMAVNEVTEKSKDFSKNEEE